MASFKETLAALSDEEKAMTLTAERYEEARKEWEEIETRYAKLRANLSDDDDGDTLDRVTGLVRRFGPTAAKWFGGPAAGASIASFMADDGGFAEFTGVFSLIGQIFGLGN